MKSRGTNLSNISIFSEKTSSLVDYLWQDETKHLPFISPFMTSVCVTRRPQTAAGFRPGVVLLLAIEIEL